MPHALSVSVCTCGLHTSQCHSLSVITKCTPKSPCVTNLHYTEQLKLLCLFWHNVLLILCRASEWGGKDFLPLNHTQFTPSIGNHGYQCTMWHVVIPEFTASNEGSDPYSTSRGPPQLWLSHNHVQYVGVVGGGWWREVTSWIFLSRMVTNEYPGSGQLIINPAHRWCWDG